MGLLRDLELLKSRLELVRESCVKAVLLFGSRARGEHGERSDADLLVLHEGCGISDIVMRRRYLYNALREALGEVFEDITLIDMELGDFLKPREVSSLLLNIYWDAVVVYDKTGAIEDFLKRVRGRIMESGLKRIREGKGYYWELPKPMEEVRIL